MRSLGSLLLAILVAIVGFWLFFKLLGFAFKLLAIGIGIALALVVYFAAEKLIGRRGDA
jgi:uncharacterized membrane protein